MDKIERMKCYLRDEAIGAKHYAEKYIFYVNSKPEWAKMYAEMARQEASHARNLHRMFQESVDEMRWVPDETKEEWEHCVAQMTETLALVELMLSK